MTDTKPPLPTPGTRTDWHHDGCGQPAYTAEQMHAYADAAVAAERYRLRQLVEAIRDANADAGGRGDTFHLSTEAQRTAWVRLMDALEKT